MEAHRPVVKTHEAVRVTDRKADIASLGSRHGIGPGRSEMRAVADRDGADAELFGKSDGMVHSAIGA